jgi:hypothetical protein
MNTIHNLHRDLGDAVKVVQGDATALPFDDEPLPLR